jgi:aarF domain-containing kinase
MRTVFRLGRLVSPLPQPFSCSTSTFSFSSTTARIARLSTTTSTSGWATSTRSQSTLLRLLRTRGHKRSSWRSSSYTLLASVNGAALGTAAFVQLSEEDNDGTEETAEMRMLQVSREEIRKRVDDGDTGLRRIGQQIVLFLDFYIWEPLCTGIRFIQLAAIFVPVIITVPVMWVGRRQPDHDNERSGTLWWYKFLVQAMEWAGPAFIKVGTCL